MIQPAGSRHNDFCTAETRSRCLRTCARRSFFLTKIAGRFCHVWRGCTHLLPIYTKVQSVASKEAALHSVTSSRSLFCRRVAAEKSMDTSSLQILDEKFTGMQPKVSIQPQSYRAARPDFQASFILPRGGARNMIN